jgi:ribonuclease P/MRP protein subunit POP5
MEKSESKPKILPPSMRPKKRYLVFEIITNEKISYMDFINVAWESMLEFLGDLKTSEARVWFIQNLFNAEKKRGVVKVDHACVEDVRASLAMINIIGESKAVIKVLGVTGTIKSAQVKYLS